MSIALGVAALAFMVQSQSVSMDILQGGRKVGSATYEAMLTPTGKSTTFTTSLGPLEAIEMTELDRFGQQVRIEVVTGRRPNEDRLLVTFDAKGNATMSGNRQGKPVSKVVPFLRKGSRRDLSEFWILRTRPKPGNWVQFYSFSAARGTWDLTRTTYMGHRTRAVGGRRVSAHLLRQTRAGQTTSIWLDNNGMPVAIDARKFRMERR